MKYISITLVVVFLFSGCSSYYTYYGLTAYPSTQLTSKKRNAKADKQVDSINHYLSTYAPDCYVQFIRQPTAQILGFCFYLNDSTYTKIQQLMKLPSFRLHELDDGPKLERIATTAATWLWNNVDRKNRADAVRVVLGVDKNHAYNTYDFELVLVEKENPFPPGFGDDRDEYELRFTHGFQHRGYELIRKCFYCL